jgi:hypothetical protein
MVRSCHPLPCRCSGGSSDPFSALPLTSANLPPGGYPASVRASQSTTKLFTAHRHASDSTLPWPLGTHSKTCKPIPFRGLHHDSLNIRTWGSLPLAHRSFTPSLERVIDYRVALQTTTIPFRITSFADPHPLTLIESHSYKKHRGRFKLKRDRLLVCLFKLYIFLGI